MKTQILLCEDIADFPEHRIMDAVNKKPGNRVLVLASSFRQSKEPVKRIRDSVNPPSVKWGIDAIRLGFDNGSSITAFSVGALRNFKEAIKYSDFDVIMLISPMCIPQEQLDKIFDYAAYGKVE